MLKKAITLLQISGYFSRQTTSHFSKFAPRTQITDKDYHEKQQKSFESYKINQKSISLLNQKGIKQFLPIQAKTYMPIFQGKNLIAGDKTGSGKTIAFCLPVIEKLRSTNSFSKQVSPSQKGIKFVVLAPTRQLVVQISKQIRSLRHHPRQFQVISLFGGTSVGLNLKQLKRYPDVLVGTPGRILDLMDRGALNFQNVQVACIDQADHMFDIGFKDSITDILQTIKNSSKNQCQFLCFSATINSQVQNLTNRFMKDKTTIISPNQTPQTIKHFQVHVSSSNQKFPTLLYLIQNFQSVFSSKSEKPVDNTPQTQPQSSTPSSGQSPRILIFTNKKSTASELLQTFFQYSIFPNVIHGDVQQQARIRRLNRFRTGQISILIATDVAARGLDIPNVEMVVNFDSPSNEQAYLHRAGRTGRAGRDGICVTIQDGRNSNYQERSYGKKGRNNSILERVQKRMKKKIKYIILDEEVKIFQNQNMIQMKKNKKVRQYKQSPKNQSQQNLSKTKLIVFDKKGKLTQQKIRNVLNQNNIKWSRLYSRITRETKIQLFFVQCINEQDAKKALDIPIVEDKQKYNFNRQRQTAK